MQYFWMTVRLCVLCFCVFLTLVSMVMCLYVSGKRGVAATYGYILGGSVA